MGKAQQTLERFLKAWKAGNYLKIYKHSQVTWKSNHSKSDIEAMFMDNPIIDYCILDYQGVILPSREELIIKVKNSQGRWSEPIKVNVLCESAPYKPEPNGAWGVNPISILKINYASSR